MLECAAQLGFGLGEFGVVATVVVSVAPVFTVVEVVVLLPCSMGDVDGESVASQLEMSVAIMTSAQFQNWEVRQTGTTKRR